MAEPLAVLEGVTRVFSDARGERTPVRDASAVLRPGGRIAVVGPSGSGKTTLLHLLAGLDQPTSGRLSWPALGERSALRPLKVGMAFQGPSLIPTLTVEQNVALPSLLGGASEKAASDRSASALCALGLEVLSARFPDELSAGQAQRVAMARALSVRPMLVLADEPTGQLDHATSALFFAAVLARLDPGSCLVVATHDEALAKSMDQRWTLVSGRLEQAP